MSFDFNRFKKLQKDENYYQIGEEQQQRERQQQANLEAMRQRQAQQVQQAQQPSVWDKVTNIMNNIFPKKQEASEDVYNAIGQYKTNSNSANKIYNPSFLNNDNATAAQNITDRFNSKAPEKPTVKDSASGLKNVLLGAKTGIKQIANYGENMSEQVTPQYKNIQEQSFFRNPNISKEEKFAYETQKGIKYDGADKIEVNKTKEAIKKSIQKDQEEIQKNIDETKSPALKKLAELAPSVGQMGVGAALGAIPGIGQPLAAEYFFTSAGGGYIDEAKQRGMTDEQAFKFGTIMGAAESATEMLTIGNLAKAGKGIKAIAFGSTVAKEAGKEAVTSTIKEALKDYAIGIGENFAQEAVIEPIQEATAHIIGGSDKADWDNIGQRMIQSGIDGALIAAITGGAEMGVQSCVGVTEKISNGVKLEKQEITQAIQDAQKAGIDIETTAKQGAQTAINQYAKQEYDNLKINVDEVINKQQKNNTDQIKIDSDNFSKQIDAVKNGTFPKKDMLTLGQTPQVLKDIGLPELPITMTQKHLDTIMNESGKYENANYHGLGEDIVKQLPEAINNPLDIVKSNTKDDSIVLTTYLADKQDNPVIASIKIDGKGRVNDVIIDTNVMTSAYGKSNYDNFMKKNLEEGNLLYDIDRGVIKKATEARLQLPRVGDFSSTNSITQNNENVNTINSNYMQNQENNANLPTKKQNESTDNSTLRVNPPTSEDIQNNAKRKVEESKIKRRQQAEEIKKKTPRSEASIESNLPDTMQYISEKRTKKKVPVKQYVDEFAQKVVNKGHYIDKLAKQTGNKNLKYLYDRTMTTFNEAQVAIGDNQTNTKGEVVGKSLLDIYEPIREAKLTKEFDDYLLNKHNISREAVGKSIYPDEITASTSKKKVAEYEKAHPEFKEWANEVNKFNDNNIRDLVDNGLISEDLYKQLKSIYGDYVPTFRDITQTMQEFGDSNVGNNGIKRAKGGNQNVLAPEESIAEQTLAIKKAIRLNNLGKELYKTLGGKQLGDPVKLDANTMFLLDGNVIEKAKDGYNTFTIFDKGEMIQFKISDELYSAFKKDTFENNLQNGKYGEGAKKLLNGVAKVTSAHRNLLTTYRIGFALTNPIKDIQDAVINTKYSEATFAKNYARALYNLAKDGDWYQSYKNNGGTANTYFDYNKGLVPSKKSNPVKGLVNSITYINEVLEQAPRLAEYISTIENGGSIDEALYNAADITTNFKRGGDVTKAVNKYGVNFLNASVQGLDKIYRNVADGNFKSLGRLAIRATIAQITPAVINGLLYSDDDDYEDLPEYTKDNYFLYKLNNNGDFLRIPKGRLSSMVGGIARRALETVEGKDVDWKSIIDTSINQLAPNNPVTDNIAAPLAQAKNNKSWFGGAIVNSRIEKLPNEEQFDETTDKLSIYIGEKLGISPKKLNYVLSQYSGGIGDVLLPIATPQYKANVVEDKFTTNSILKNKNVSEFYTQMEELEKNKNSSKATDEDKLKYKYMTDVNQELSDLYQKKRDIQITKYDNKQKKQDLIDIQKQINDIVENKLNTVNSISVDDNTAKIGDKEYYKLNDTWTELKDENKISGVPIKDYATYKNATTGLSKETEKAEALKNTSIPSGVKAKIYENTIGKDDKTYQTAMKSGMTINEYLDYKSNSINSVSDMTNYLDNCNLNQDKQNFLYSTKYSLKSSADKSQLISYINSLNISKEEKLNIIGSLKGFKLNGDKVSW